MNRYYGYHRTSTHEQHLERGIAEIQAFCAQNNIELKDMFLDQHTGKEFCRNEYKVLKRVLDDQDNLIITEIDRLGRNKAETMKELQYYKEHNIRLLILEIPTTLMDISKMDNDLAKLMLETINNMMIELYVSMAEAEMHKKEKRQREGLEQLKLRGEWERMGRPRVMKQADFNREYEKVLKGDIAPFELMRQLDMKKSTYYVYKANYEKSKLSEIPKIPIK